MEAHSEEVGAEPGPSGHDITKDEELHEPFAAHQATPAGVQADGAPHHNQDGTIFLGIPAPEPAPALVRPDATQHRTDEAGDEPKSEDAIGGPGERVAVLVVGLEGAETEVNRANQASHEGRGIADRYGRHVRR